MNAEALIGKVLGTCTLQQLIGQGGMGAVFLAQQSRPRRQVAVKVLLPLHPLAPNQQAAFLERFRRETDAAASLVHPNIVPVHEYGEDDGLAYLVMPYIAGGTLRDELEREGAMPLAKVMYYLDQMAAALDFAHDRGVIHRDIKPANILKTLEGRLLLTDFGLVKIVAEGQAPLARLTGIGVPMGTPDYMAPEQAMGAEIDQRADLYSLGVILYQMVTGTVPFKGDMPMQIAMQHMHMLPPPPRSLRSDLPESAEQVIWRALAKRPDERFAYAQDLADAFRQALVAAGVQLANDATTAVPVVELKEGRAFKRRSLFDPMWRQQKGGLTLMGESLAQQRQGAHDIVAKTRMTLPTLSNFLAPQPAAPNKETPAPQVEVQEVCSPPVPPAQTHTPIPVMPAAPQPVRPSKTRIASVFHRPKMLSISAEKIPEVSESVEPGAPSRSAQVEQPSPQPVAVAPAQQIGLLRNKRIRLAGGTLDRTDDAQQIARNTVQAGPANGAVFNPHQPENQVENVGGMTEQQQPVGNNDVAAVRRQPTSLLTNMDDSTERVKSVSPLKAEDTTGVFNKASMSQEQRQQGQESGQGQQIFSPLTGNVTRVLGDPNASGAPQPQASQGTGMTGFLLPVGNVTQTLEETSNAAESAQTGTGYLPVVSSPEALSSGTTSAFMVPGQTDEAGNTTTMRLTQSVRVVKVPVAGQPGRYMTGLLPVTPAAPASEPAEPLKQKLQRNRNAVIAAALVVLMLLGSLGAWLTLSHQQTATPTKKLALTPNATATVFAQATATAQANIILTDALKENANNWPVAEKGPVTYIFKDGAYHLAVNDPQHMAFAIYPNQSFGKQLGYSVSLWEVKGEDDSYLNWYGVFLRYNERNGHKMFYAFRLIPESKKYAFSKYDDSYGQKVNPWTDLWSQKAGNEYHAGHGPQNKNTVKVTTKGDTFTFTVNGKQVGTAKDGSLAEGSIGMVVNRKGTEV
ncbi:MAG: protein kinase, partial [Ktedonobacteraceae bacterium]|nr:protein kinase [Ktedonobacteraceae bacterium]